jgi:hypothetical protein
MSVLSLQERLVQYLKKHPGTTFPKAELADLARERMGVTGESVGRRLRVLAEVSQWGYRPTVDTPEHERAAALLAGGKVIKTEVKGHAHYTYQEPATKTVRRVVIEDGRAKEIIETVNTQ